MRTYPPFARIDGSGYDYGSGYVWEHGLVRLWQCRCGRRLVIFNWTRGERQPECGAVCVVVRHENNLRTALRSDTQTYTLHSWSHLIHLSQRAVLPVIYSSGKPLPSSYKCHADSKHCILHYSRVNYAPGFVKYKWKHQQWFDSEVYKQPITIDWKKYIRSNLIKFNLNFPSYVESRLKIIIIFW